ncbi:HlyD family type I secretion periplasmic adaptor subunit [Bradyrhizobium cenepequi]|uniref:HlyD family type I secretion periplasmic adaptor subunit n=1 Tax=Bradyrhizobium cenepequi TaxID=2821403 RepID=UPI001CE2CFC7|nr:HlyD family type I secretion periplasmic adaptor subunit [Bradyrhizobium cenepequi]MCA6110934.1 HlyD family type I secretion periplasmic adaptor subunit [Bradyrhizobium cenepequi]
MDSLTKSQAYKGIATPIARDRRATPQIGSDVGYQRVTRGVRNLLIGVIGLVALLVFMSLFVNIEEVARARGEFIPVQRVQNIQTAEGGLLEAILVRNDDRVSKDQVLAKFRATDLLRDLDLTDVRIGRLEIEVERLDAFVTGRDPDLEKYRAKFPQMVNEALALHKQQVLRLQRDLEQKDHAISEVKTAIASAEQKIPAAKGSLQATQDLLERTREGARLGVIARNRVAGVEEQAAQSERTYVELVSTLDELKSRIRSIEAEQASLTAKAASDARNERAERIGQLNEANVTLAALRARSQGVEVTAPVNGIVHKVSETPIGTVIPAGGTVLEVVPTDGGVLMQARVTPRDIGFVHVGQKALVKADAFEYGRFGAIEAKVARISPSSDKTPQGQEPFFVAEMELERDYVGVDRAHVVTPGMTGEVSILTGQKTIFQYLLKPIYVTLDSALRER